MILAIGLVVDDAIIVVERVQYLMLNEKMDAKSASVKAMQQIASAIVATTFVLLSIFIPVGLMAGITGKIYQQFAVTIATSVAFSAFNALTLSPALCSIFLKGDDGTTNNPFFVWFNDLITFFRDKYVAVVGYFSTYLKLTAVVVLATIAVVMLTFAGTATSFIPEEDQGIIFTNVQLRNTATINQTNELLDKLGQEVMQEEGVEYFISVAGYSMLGGGGENVALGVIGLKPWKDRTAKSLSMESITNHLTAKYGQNADAEINFFAPPSIPGIGRANGLTFEMLAIRNSLTPADLFDKMESFLGQLNQKPEMSYAFSTFTADTPHVFLDIDRTKLEAYNVPVSNLFTALQNNLGSRYINNITLNGQVNKVIIQADFQYRQNLRNVENMYVRSKTGDLVRIKSFATVSTEISPNIVYRYNQYTFLLRSQGTDCPRRQYRYGH